MKKLYISYNDALYIQKEIKKELHYRKKNLYIYNDVIEVFMATVDSYYRDDIIIGKIEFEMDKPLFKDLRKVITYIDDSICNDIFNLRRRVIELEKRKPNTHYPKILNTDDKETIPLLKDKISLNLKKLKINKSVKDDINLILKKKNKELQKAL